LLIRTHIRRALAGCLFVALPVFAAAPPRISGTVEDRNHVPLLGAVVELFTSSPFPVLTAFTDVRGHYEFQDVPPGRYSVRVLQADALPVRRRNIQVGRSSHLIINLTMLSLSDALNWFPASRPAVGEPGDEWKWALRSGVNRPMLRWIDSLGEESLIEHPQARHASPDHPVAGRLAVTSGSQDFGQGGVQQQAQMEMAQGSANTALLHIQTSTSGAAFIGGGIERSAGLGDTSRAVATFRTLPVGNGLGVGRMQVLSLRGGEQVTLSDSLVAQFGAESEAAQAGQNVTAVLPFMAVRYGDSNSSISYRLATADDLQDLTDIASSASLPDVAMQNGTLRIAHYLHQEMSVGHRLGGLDLQAAYFYDHVTNPVLNGYGDSAAAEFAAGDVLLDPVTGAFRTAGSGYSGGGVRLVATRQLRGNWWTSVEYADGPALSIPAGDLLSSPIFSQAVDSVTSQRMQSLLVSMRGVLPGSAATRWQAGYRLQPEASVTAVDPFNTGMSAPYLSVVLRQPVGPQGDSPDRLELEVVMQNLLAQGYRPIYILAGQTLYLAQGPRLVTGGLAFSF
jgi:hypothetical protein